MFRRIIFSILKLIIPAENWILAAWTLQTGNSRLGQKLKYSLYFFCSISLFFITGDASAERITICEKRAFTAQSATACTFDTVTGEEIITNMSYRDSDDVRGMGYVEIKHNGAFMNGGWSSGTIRLHPPSQDSTLRRFINPQQRGRSWVSYSMANHSTSPPDIVYIGVESDRTNLALGGPNINQSNGDLTLPYSVTTNTPFTPGSTWVSYKMWSHGNNGTATNSAPTVIEERGLGACVNRSRCQDNIIVPFLQRKPLPRGHTSLYGTVNDQFEWAETTRHDNRFDWAGIISDYFHEKIPGIMGRRAANWELAKHYLNVWFDDGLLLKNQNEPGIDWALNYLISVNTAWLIDRNNASDSRILDEYQTLKKKDVFLSDVAKKLLADRVRKTFQDNPSLKEFSLSKKYTSAMYYRTYHNQHIAHRVAQSGGLTLDYRLDAVSAAFGGFAFYFVPVGKAYRDGEGNKHKITITGSRIHVVDSFDFNGFQALGCWKEPNIVEVVSYTGRCAFNADFRWYRFMKARGLDFNIFTIPKEETFTKPINFLIRKQ